MTATESGRLSANLTNAIMGRLLPARCDTPRNAQYRGVKKPVTIHRYRLGLQGSATLSRYLGQEPGAALGLIDSVLDQAGGRDIVVPLTEFMGGTQPLD
jgi:hypothetical protein